MIALEQGSRAFEALLFPIALAMVELARVPLALALRTRNSWNIKLAAAFGVGSAIVVTSFSLSTIAYRTFDPRLSQANDTHNEYLNLQSQRTTLTDQKLSAEAAVEHEGKQRDIINDHIKNVTSQLTAQPAQTCTAVQVPNPVQGMPPSTRQACKDNPVLKPLQAELATLNVKLKQSDATLTALNTNAEQARKQVVQFDDKLVKAETNYRETVNHSQLHSYTAMLFRKDPREVSDAEVKTLEWYLIIIPSIAAAFASTLIAITAVRRVNTPRVATSIPDEAVEYLFGPLLAGIRAEAQRVALEAVNFKTAASACGA
jgi:hypothetical protein